MRAAALRPLSGLLAPCCAAVLGLGSAAAGQPPPDPGGAAAAREGVLPQDPPPPEPTAQQAALATLAESIAAKQRDVDAAAQEALAAARAGDDARRLRALATQREAEAALARLRRQFQSVAAEVDIEEFQAAESKPFDLLEETVTTLRPLIEQLKDATASPREMERLESEVEAQKRRRNLATRAVQRLDQRLGNPDNDALTVYLTDAREAWTDRLRDANARLAVAQQQLQQRQAEQRPLWDLVTEGFDTFVRTRGLNLLIGLLAVVAVLLVMRGLPRVYRRLRPSRRGVQLGVYGRLGSVVWRALTAVTAVAALLLAFYATGDWLLLLLTLVFLAGLGWASLKMAPQFFEQVRLLLNLGSVREGERLVLGGIPWRVERLRFYSHLVNPKLTGGLLRMPLRDLTGLHSRPVGSGELWFPTSRGDWVLLEDGSHAQVVLQTPDLVRLQKVGGALVTCRTGSFVDMGLCNLADGFRIQTTFGIDYAHQAISTTRVPGIMQAALRREIAELVGEEHLVGLKVEFKEAGPSSLDYAALADFQGEVGRDYARLRRAIPRVLVDVCNEQGWTIPFTQITLHQATA